MPDLKIILASKSPRRQGLIRDLGIPFEVRIHDVDEVYPDTLAAHEVPGYLARLKSTPLIDTLKEGEVLLTSDTVVIQDGIVLGKPKNAGEASEMLRSLSGNSHEVITGVSLVSRQKEIRFDNRTMVHFDSLTPEEIAYYIDRYQPYDKAGSYGIQEWIGYIGIRKIEGCYYNVMGLPVHQVYQTLKREFGLKP